MEQLLSTILSDTESIRLAILSIPERQAYIGLFVTVITFWTVAFARVWIKSQQQNA